MIHFIIYQTNVSSPHTRMHARTHTQTDKHKLTHSHTGISYYSLLSTLMRTAAIRIASQISSVSQTLKKSQNCVLRSYPELSEESSFTVRRATSLEDLKFAFDIANDENWGLAHGDAECFFTADPQGYFIGELDGKKICSTALISYPRNRVCVGGLSVTDPAYRKKGYARKLLEPAFVLRSVPEDYCMHGECTNELIHYYVDVLSLRYLGWINYCTIIPAVQALDALRLIPPVRSTNVVLTSTTDVECEDLCVYEEQVMNLYRKEFLMKWTTLLGRQGWVAIDTAGSIRGFAVSRQIINPDDIYKIAPLYADSPDIACRLLQRITERVVSANKDAKLYLDVPSDNSHAVQLIRNHLGGRVLWELRRIYSKRVEERPPIAVDKVYGLTSQTVG